MFCNKCGTKLEANAKVCHGCNSIISNEGNNQLLNSTNNQVIPSNHVNQDVMPIDASLNKKLDTTEVNNKPKIKKVIIVILIVIMFLVSIFFGYKFVKKYLADLKESVTYDINYKNYTLTILNRYLYDSSNYNNDFLTFSDDPSNYVVSLNIASGNYQNLENNYLKLKPIYENNDIIVKNISVKELYGRKYIALDINKEGNSYMLMYTKLDSNNIITLLLINKNQTYDYMYVKNVNPLLENIKVNYFANNNIIDKDFVLPDIKILTN